MRRFPPSQINAQRQNVERTADKIVELSTDEQPVIPCITPFHGVHPVQNVNSIDQFSCSGRPGLRVEWTEAEFTIPLSHPGSLVSQSTPLHNQKTSAAQHTLHIPRLCTSILASAPGLDNNSSPAVDSIGYCPILTQTEYLPSAQLSEYQSKRERECRLFL